MFSGDRPAVCEVEKGPICQTVRARYAMGEICSVVQEITLFKGVRRVECRTILVDVQREDYLFCATFPTYLKGLVPVFDERFGAVARNDSKKLPRFPHAPDAHVQRLRGIRREQMDGIRQLRHAAGRRNAYRSVWLA